MNRLIPIDVQVYLRVDDEVVCHVSMRGCPLAAWALASPNEGPNRRKGNLACPSSHESLPSDGAPLIGVSDVGAADSRRGAAAAGHADTRIVAAARAGLPTMRGGARGRAQGEEDFAARLP